jgi:hypothetical protein
MRPQGPRRTGHFASEPVVDTIIRNPCNDAHHMKLTWTLPHVSPVVFAGCALSWLHVLKFW